MKEQWCARQWPLQLEYSIEWHTQKSLPLGCFYSKGEEIIQQNKDNWCGAKSSLNGE